MKQPKPKRASKAKSPTSFVINTANDLIPSYKLPYKSAFAPFSKQKPIITTQVSCGDDTHIVSNGCNDGRKHHPRSPCVAPSVVNVVTYETCIELIDTPITILASTTTSQQAGDDDCCLEDREVKEHNKSEIRRRARLRKVHPQYYRLPYNL